VRLVPAALAVLALALPLAACGGEEEEPAGGGGSGGGVTIDMKDIKYVPADATVPVGQTVTWTNSDSVAHTVTKESGVGPDFDSGTIAAGKTFKQKFGTEGEIAYYCTLHPNQKGTLTVE
jgi:plastocyanin